MNTLENVNTVELRDQEGTRKIFMIYRSDFIYGGSGVDSDMQQRGDRARIGEAHYPFQSIPQPRTRNPIKLVQFRPTTFLAEE